MNWELDRDAVRAPNQKKPEKITAPRSGSLVAPGDYQVVVAYAGDSAQGQVTVVKDPRLELSEQQMQEKETQIKKHQQLVETTTKAADRLREVQASIAYINKKIKDLPEQVEMAEKGKALNDSAQAILNLIFPPEDTQGIYRDFSLVGSKLQEVGYLMDSPLVPWTKNQQLAFGVAEQAVKEIIQKTNSFISGAWQEYREKIQAQSILVPEYQDLNLN